MRDRRVERDVQAAARGGQFEALRPAVDGRPRQGRPVQRRRPALVGRVGDAQDAAGLALGDLRVEFDGARGDGLRLVGPGHDRGAGDLPVHAPQGGAVLLAEPGQAGRGVEDTAHLPGRARAYEDVAHGEAAELVGLVGAGAA